MPMKFSSGSTHTIASSVLRISVASTAILVSYSIFHYIRRQQKNVSDRQESSSPVSNHSSCSNHQHKEQMTSQDTTSHGTIPKEVHLMKSTEKDDTQAHIQDPNSFAFVHNNIRRRILAPNTISIAYASTTGTCTSFATDLYNSLQTCITTTQRTMGTTNTMVQLFTVDQIDWWEELLQEEDEDEEREKEENQITLSNSSSPLSSPPILLFILPTWTNGTLPEPYNIVLTSLQDIRTDWRVAPHPLRRVSPNMKTKENTRKKGKNMTVRIASFGIGSSAYDPSTFCKPAMDVFTHLIKLGAHSLLGSSARTATTTYTANQNPTNPKNPKRNMVVGMGDCEFGDHASQSFIQWKTQVLHHIQPLYSNFDIHFTQEKECGPNDHPLKKNKNPNHNNNSMIRKIDIQSPSEHMNCCTSHDANNEEGDCKCKKEDDGKNSSCRETQNHAKVNVSIKHSSQIGDKDMNLIHDDCNETKYNYEEEEEEEDDDEEEDEDEDDLVQEPDVMDLEDIGNAVKSASSFGLTDALDPKEMVTPKQAAALKKEGYKLIGTHSAVKLCRWTKHQLRGRGGCYKHTFYGITSYQCMEATPSLACANKCVFCWRHHKNPVGKEWRWKTDDPYFIVEEAVKEHVNMIKETKGIPGVKMDRWKEAHVVRHCALSLVGEPIMYPRINELLGELHRRSISTFLVTNGQHPGAIETVRPVTQLYVSVDASTPETLEAIDRPLFKDAWDRLCTSLKCLKSKGQRTVARLTVVKGWNSDEIEGYAKLIALGQCSFVEVKGVTYCGKSDASNLNMSNSPYHHEVLVFSKKLVMELTRLRSDPATYESIPEYDVACEHKHSCSVLIARVDQFALSNSSDGKRRWYTWIDYEKFQELASRNNSDPTFSFTAKDYSAETPSWALSGADEEGFDPVDARHRKKSKLPKYTKFDFDGVPTHDEFGKELDVTERNRLIEMMKKKRIEIGDGQSVTETKCGEKTIEDASLMFRGLVVGK